MNMKIVYRLQVLFFVTFIKFTFSQTPAQPNNHVDNNTQENKIPIVRVKLHNEPLDPFENLAQQMMHDLFDDSDEKNNGVTKTVQHDPQHHKTITKTSGPGFESVVVTQVLGGGDLNHNIGGPGLGDPVIIPIFRAPRRIHLKTVRENENPFKIFKELDDIFESFLDGFARGIAEDSEQHNKTINERNEIKKEIEKLNDQINNEKIVVTNIRDITNEVKDDHLPALTPQTVNVIEKNVNNREEINKHKEELNKNNNIQDTVKEGKKQEEINAKSKKKESSFFTRIFKYVLYLVFICTGLFIGKVILDKMSLNNSDNKNENQPQQSPITNSEVNNKPRSELKVMREDKNKYY